MQPSDNLAILSNSVKEVDSAIGQRRSNCILIRQVFNGQNDTSTINFFVDSHCLCVIDSHNAHSLLVKDDLIDLSEIINLLDVVIVGGLVPNGWIFNVAHICGWSILNDIDLVLDQIGGELFEFQHFGGCFLATVEKVDYLPDKEFSVVCTVLVAISAEICVCYRFLHQL